MELKLPLSNVQLELMKLFATNLSNEDLEDLEDLKDLLAKFYADKAIANANAVWDEKGLTDTDMEIWLQKS
ncbi:MAG: hypothetical protein H0X70_06690 [Segetibacter sp.]|nr:hypothetical protein [Segetibacter sp.]